MRVSTRSHLTPADHLYAGMELKKGSKMSWTTRCTCARCGKVYDAVDGCDYTDWCGCDTNKSPRIKSPPPRIIDFSDDDEDDDERIVELEEELDDLRRELRESRREVSELEEDLEIFGEISRANYNRRFLPRHGRNWGGPSSR